MTDDGPTYFSADSPEELEQSLNCPRGECAGCDGGRVGWEIMDLLDRWEKETDHSGIQLLEIALLSIFQSMRQNDATSAVSSLLSTCNAEHLRHMLEQQQAEEEKKGSTTH